MGNEIYRKGYHQRVFVQTKISRAVCGELAKFKKPTHQIRFHTAKALTTLEFLKGYEVNE